MGSEDDWRIYVWVNDALTHNERAAFERSVSEIWATPEGKALILAAYQNNPREGERIEIRSGPISSAFPEGGIIRLSPELILRLRFTEGQNPDGSAIQRNTDVTETLVHELFHLADIGNIRATRSLLEAIPKVGTLLDSSMLELGTSIVELAFPYIRQLPLDKRVQIISNVGSQLDGRLKQLSFN